MEHFSFILNCDPSSLGRVVVVLSCVLLLEQRGLLPELLRQLVGVGGVELKVEVEVEEAELPEIEFR